MLERHGARVVARRQARREPLDDGDARDLLAGVREVTIARGGKADTRPAGEVTPAMLKGPRGTYRAPMLVRGKKLLVGFSAETLEDWLGG